jgi:hypothetical protein
LSVIVNGPVEGTEGVPATQTGCAMVSNNDNNTNEAATMILAYPVILLSF